MGKELVEEGKYEQALEVLRKASELRPGQSEPLMQMGWVHLQRQAPEAAVRAYRAAQKLSGPSYEIHTRLAEALSLLGRHDEALAELDWAIGLNPDVAEDHYRMGVALDELGRHEEAIEALARAIELDPQQVAYHQSLGFTLESMGKRREAIKCFKRALELERPTRPANPAKTSD